ncbi:hypothetical protein [Microcoleus asticus]|nr:hypothetical protein [Microcoleus asticus]
MRSSHQTAAKYLTFKSPESYYRTGNKANTVKFVEELKQINPTG